MSKRTIIGIAVLLLALGAAWFFLSPAYALSQLRDAAIAGDKAALEQRIDFPAVRAALKADLREEMGAQQGEGEDEAGLGTALAMGLADGMIDGLVTPETMAAMIKAGNFSDSNQPGGQEETEWEIDRQGFGRFSATPVAPEGEAVLSLVFERDGLGWKMVDIDMPRDPSAPAE